MSAARKVVPIRPEVLAQIMADPAACGQAPRYHMLGYRAGEVNRCPGCGRSHWWVRNLTAECGFCSTALPVLN